MKNERESVRITKVPLKPSSITGESVPGGIIHSAVNTKKPLSENMGPVNPHRGAVIHGHAFLQVSARRILNQARQGVGSDRQKLTLRLLITTWPLKNHLTSGCALNATR